MNTKLQVILNVGDVVLTSFGEDITITSNMFFVKMIDTRGNVDIVICENWRQAQIIADDVKNCPANTRGWNLQHVAIYDKMPSFVCGRYCTCIRTNKDWLLYSDPAR